MITSIFEKTRPLNYLILGILVLLSFLSYFFFNNLFQDGWASLLYFLFYFVVTVASVALVNFIILKNNLTANNNFGELLFVLFLLFFPEIFKSENILIANFFLLLGLRRLLSLRTMANVKEKLFDASFWIFIATLFHFWAIIYIVLVFVSIVLDFSRDFKNWLIPFIAFVTVAILFVALNLIFNNQIIAHLINQTGISFNFYYFDTIYQNIALAVFSALALLFFANMLFTTHTKPLNLQTTYKKLIAAFVLAIVIFVVSPIKSNSLLLFSLAPISIMGANYIQAVQGKIVREVMLIILVVLSLFFFITAL
ncbi:DUF6427 family protein [Flavobacterium sp.]|uniref:DUF6427 family protein n=1 Tax=Flavobacterium sp. TaxID=239 RepID=UPI0035280E2B